MWLIPLLFIIFIARLHYNVVESVREFFPATLSLSHSLSLSLFVFEICHYNFQPGDCAALTACPSGHSFARGHNVTISTLRCVWRHRTARNIFYRVKLVKLCRCRRSVSFQSQFSSHDLADSNRQRARYAVFNHLWTRNTITKLFFIFFYDVAFSSGYLPLIEPPIWTESEQFTNHGINILEMYLVINN